METVAMLGFALTVLIGSYVQSVTGFAMGMIVVAIVGGLRIVDIPTLGASLSFLTILNVVLALRGDLQRVHKPLFLWLALGQLPAIFFGLQLMNWLDGNTRWLLELCLGLFIAAGGLSLSVRPQQRLCRSEFRVERRRRAGSADVSLPADVVVLCCSTAAGRQELAMDSSTVTGFLSWVESAPPVR